TTYTPTPEAVEAAARALWTSWNPNGPAWRATSEEYREQARSEARAALTAAGPIIAAEVREHVAREIEGFEPEDRALVHMPDWREAMYDAARIARGEGS